MMAASCWPTCSSVNRDSSSLVTARPRSQAESRDRSWWPATQLVRPVGRDEGQPLAPHGPYEEAEEVQRRRVGPVQVLDDQQHRSGCGQPVEHREQQLEQLCAGGRHRRRLAGRSQLGQESGDVRPGPAEHLVERLGRGRAGEVTEDVDHRGERHALATALDARPGQHPYASGELLGAQLLHQPRLADAGFAAQQDGVGLAVGSPADDVAEQLELLAPSDEGRADAPGGHGVRLEQPPCAEGPPSAAEADSAALGRPTADAVTLSGGAPQPLTDPRLRSVSPSCGPRTASRCGPAVRTPQLFRGRGP